MVIKERVREKEGKLAFILVESKSLSDLDSSPRGENWLEVDFDIPNDNRCHYVSTENVDGLALLRIYANGVEEGDKLVDASCIAYPGIYLEGREIEMNGKLVCKLPVGCNRVWVGDGGAKYVFSKKPE